MEWQKHRVYGDQGFCDGQDSSFLVGSSIHFIDCLNKRSSCLKMKDSMFEWSNVRLSREGLSSSQRSIFASCAIGNKGICWHGKTDNCKPSIVHTRSNEWCNYDSVQDKSLPTIRNGYSVHKYGTAALVVGASPPIPSENSVPVHVYLYKPVFWLFNDKTFNNVWIF